MKLLVILGPTASGKTDLAVAVAERMNGAIISADSRQVYRHMDIGTGKDLAAYGNIPHYLIDIVDAGNTYHVAQYRTDFHQALHSIQRQGKQPILCGGTGLYIHSVLQPFDYADVPVDQPLRETLESLPIDTLRKRLHALPQPPGFHADTSTSKRLVRAIEIATQYNSRPPSMKATIPPVPAKLFGIAPSAEQRRQRITERLQQRLNAGLLAEVRGLLASGIPAEKLLYYGLEYKYCVQHLSGELDETTFFNRLNTEIHRFAKRQMTYFRKMEKDGLRIHWLTDAPLAKMTEEVISSFVG